MISEILLYFNNNPTFWIGIFRIAIIGGLLLLFAGLVLPGISFRYGFLLMLLGFIILFGSSYVGTELQNSRPFSSVPEHYTYTNEYQIIASLTDNSLENGINGHGSFFLGSGHISINGGKSVPVYIFYKKLAPDEYTQDYIPSKDVIIKTDEETNPNIEWIYQHTISEKKTYQDNGEIVGGLESVTLIKTIIHVPKGTVKIDYNLDSTV